MWAPARLLRFLGRRGESSSSPVSMRSGSKLIALTSLSASDALGELEASRVRFRFRFGGLFGNKFEGEDGGDEERNSSSVCCLNSRRGGRLGGMGGRTIATDVLHGD